MVDACSIKQGTKQKTRWTGANNGNLNALVHGH
jgi:hypothetical protein